jgi:hypothetical protein
MGIEEAVGSGDGADGGNGLVIMERCKGVEDVVFVDGEANEGCRIVGDDPVGDFRLRGRALQREQMAELRGDGLRAKA